ncbi:MAG: PTS sugar transporter subunit IIA [Anaerolineaceae bacterium]|nr:PTS sugar transporter subunit IIA [Anaerolineaceae bacterium]
MDSIGITFADVISSGTVDLNLAVPKDKEALLEYMVSLLMNVGAIDSAEAFIESIYERESMGPTYMGDFIAIPHGKSETVKKTAIAFCRCNEGFYYPTENGGGDVKLIFMLAIPDSLGCDGYIYLLSRLARLLVHKDFVSELYSANEYEDIIKSLEKFEPLLDQ